LTGKPKVRAEYKSQPSQTTGALMRKYSGGLYLRLTSKADTYAIAYIDCILNLKGKCWPVIWRGNWQIMVRTSQRPL